MGCANCSKNFREWKRTGREVNSIAPAELNKYLAEFIYSVHRRKDGEDYEPLSLRCLVSRIEMHLKKNFTFCAHWILHLLRKGRLLNLLLSLLVESQSLVCIRNLTRSPRSLVRFLILTNSFANTIRTHLPWSILYLVLMSILKGHWHRATVWFLIRRKSFQSWYLWQKTFSIDLTRCLKMVIATLKDCLVIYERFKYHILCFESNTVENYAFLEREFSKRLETKTTFAP